MTTSDCDFSEYIISLTQAMRGAKFAGLTYTSKTTGETCKYLLNLNCSIKAAYEKDIEAIDHALAANALTPIQRDAAMDIHSSLIASLEKGIGNNPRYTQAGIWEHLGNGVRVNRDTCEVAILGLVLQRTVIVGVEPKVVRSKPLTLAKQDIHRMLQLRRDNIRNFSLSGIHKISVSGETLEFV